MKPHLFLLVPATSAAEVAGYPITLKTGIETDLITTAVQIITVRYRLCRSSCAVTRNNRRRSIKQVIHVERDAPCATAFRFTAISEAKARVVAGRHSVVVDVHTLDPANVTNRVV